MLSPGSGQPQWTKLLTCVKQAGFGVTGINAVQWHFPAILSFSTSSPRGNKGLHSIDELRYPCATGYVCTEHVCHKRRKRFKPTVEVPLLESRTACIQSFNVHKILSVSLPCHSETVFSTEKSHWFHFKKNRDHINTLGFFFLLMNFAKWGSFSLIWRQWLENPTY